MSRKSRTRIGRGSSAIIPLLTLDDGSDVPAYKQIYEGFRTGILNGRLRPGSRLPSTRDVANEMGVARNTVLSAFEQLLAEGYLQSRRGAGTYVATSLPDEMLTPVVARADMAAPHGRAPHMSRRGAVYVGMRQPEFLRGLGAFKVSLPAIEKFPLEVWSKLVQRYLQRPSRQLLTYSDPEGYRPLRETIGEYVRAARAVRCTTDQVLVVGGSQQALHLCARVLTDPGDPVWLEEPGYPGARDAFRAASAKLIPVPVDHEGLNVEAGIRRAPKPRAIYVTPSHQYPLGMTMSLNRRLQLLEYARKVGAWVIEDDYDSEYRYISRPLSALQGLDSGSCVIYLGTFSKVLFPSLRIGYIVAPSHLATVLGNAREEADIFSPTILQAALNDFIKQGHFARHLRRMRALYMHRRDQLVKEINFQLRDILTVEYADSGMHLVGLLPNDSDDVKVGIAAAEEHVITMALSQLYLREPKKSGLVLGFGGVDSGQIKGGVDRLRKAMEKSLGLTSAISAR